MPWTRPDTHRPRARLPGWRLSLVLVTSWLLLAAPIAVALFLNGSRTTVVAGHDAVVSPTLDGYATLDLGPYLPNFRYPSGGTVGAHIDLGKTTADSFSALIQRYAFIASRPDGQCAGGPPRRRGGRLEPAREPAIPADTRRNCFVRRQPSTGIRILHSLSGGACGLCHHARAQGREYLNGALLRRTFRVFHLRDL